MIEYFIHKLQTLNYLSSNNPLTILDIGSRDCMQSVEFANMFPNARILAFECNKNTLDICCKNIKDYPNIELIPKAVNNYDGKCNFYPIDKTKTITTWEDGNPGASSLFKANGQYPIETYVQYEDVVECTRIDTCLNARNIKKIDLVWIDLQGAEMIAFESFGDLLVTVDYIHTEVSFKPLYDGQVLFEKLHSYMLSQGFKNVEPIKMNEWQSDVIYGKVKKTNFIL